MKKERGKILKLLIKARATCSLISLIVLSAVSISYCNVSYADEGDTYVGGQLGINYLHYFGGTQSDGSIGGLVYSPHYGIGRIQPGTRIYAGYDINNRLGVETGIDYYGNVLFKSRGTNKQEAFPHYGFDITAKIYTDISDYSGIFAKAGYTLVNRGSFNINSLGQYSHEFATCRSESFWTPVIGLGIYYDWNKKWKFDFTWTRVMPVASEMRGSYGLPLIDCFNVGVCYKFDVLDLFNRF